MTDAGGAGAASSPTVAPRNEAAASEPAPTAAAPPRRARRPSPEFRRRGRLDLKSRLSIAFADAMSWVVDALPTPVRNWAADRVGDVWIRLTPTYRASVIANIGQVVGPRVSMAEKERMARNIFRITARNFADLFRAPRMSRGELTRSLPMMDGDWAYLDEPLARGQGVVLVTAHLGPFDFIGHVLAARGYPLTTVTGRTTTRFLFDAATWLRQKGGMEMAEASPSGIRKVILALRRGEVAVFVADYDLFQNGLPVTFFGRETTLPPGPVRIARDTGAVIVAAFARRVGAGYALTLMPPFTPPKTRDLDADLAAGMAMVVERLERAIAASVDQWVVFQRVWPLTPPEPFRVFPIGSPLESEFLKRVDAVLPPRRAE
jgi:lauroyl/myristoyl acyltransferase